MLFSNPFFWLGQIGLVLSISGCAVLLHRFRTEKYSVLLPLWFFLLMCLAMLVRPTIINVDHSIPATPYLYRFAMGVLIASRTRVWRASSEAKEQRNMDKILRFLMLAGTLFLLFLGYKLKNK